LSKVITVTDPPDLSHDTLKPCPFCGGPAELKNPGYEYYSPCWCKCTQCGAEGPTKSSELEAEEWWNKRIKVVM